MIEEKFSPQKLNMIFYDSPISRAYVNIIRLNNIKIGKIIFLINKKFRFLPNKLAIYMNFNRNNYRAIELQKDEIFFQLKNQILSYFSLDNSFYDNLYSFKNYYNISGEIIYVKNDDINSDELYNLICDKKNDYLYTGGGILKERILNTNNRFFHIHPGYLPEVRGADGLLWSALKFNCFGVSFFQMNKEIDGGKVFNKKKFDLPKFYLKNIKNYEVKKIYRFIYGFLDPVLRAKFLNEIFFNINLSKNTVEDESKGNYFSFMDNKKIIESFEKFSFEK